MDKDPSDAAQDAVDGDRLLAGEDPDSRDPEDAAHWIRVYSELVAFKRDLIARTEGRAGDMVPAATQEVEATDLPVLHAEAERLEGRLAFWQRRATEAEG